MQIRKLHIYRYGRFEDVTIDSISPKLQVIFGVNEAGKSTIMAFIRGILFGFTIKKKDYTPNGGGTIGGSLTIEMPDRGVVTIERTSTGGKGNAKLFFDNGAAAAGEEALQTLLRGLDLSMFDAIFSFDLEGLQGLEKIEAEELNDYLFHAGMTGSLPIRALEKKLQKREGELFKPNGRKPVLNQYLAKLQEAEQELRKWQQQNESYQQLLDQAESAQTRIQEIERLKYHNLKRIRELETRKTLRPLVEEKHMWQSRLNQLPDYRHFPEDGLARFEKWQSQAVALQGEKLQFEKQKAVLCKKLEEISADTALINKKDEIYRLKEEYRWITEQDKRKTSLLQELKTEEEELQVLFESLGSVWNEQAVIHTDIGLSAKDELKEHIQQKEGLLQQQKILDDELTRLEQTVQEHRRKKQQLNEDLLSDQEREQMEDQLYNSDEAGKKQIEKEQLVKQLNRLTSQSERAKGSTSRPHSLLFYGLTALGAVLCIWMLSSGMPFIALVTALLFSAFGFYVMKLNQNASLHPSSFVQDLESQMEQLEEDMINESDIKETDRIKKTLEEDDSLRQMFFVLNERLRQDQRVYENALGRYDDLQKRLSSTNESLNAWCRKRHFPESHKHTQLLDVFQRAEEAKRRIRRCKRHRESLQTIDHELEQWTTQVKDLCALFQISYGEPISVVHQLLGKLQEAERHMKEQQQFNAKIESLSEHIASLSDKMSDYHNKCLQLMKQAGVSDEDAYRRKAKAWHESRNFLDHLHTVDSRIAALLPGNEERNSTIREILNDESDEQLEIARLEEENQSLAEEEKKLNKSIAELEARQRQLEEGGTHAELLHRFQQKKDQFEFNARRWAVYRTAAHFLKKAKEQYRNERQPKVTALAERYFAVMTEHRYQRLFAPNDGGFAVEREDGIRFSSPQLSRGTTEQLYLALRLALAQIYESASPYPVIMDDILVNFDHQRTQKALQVIREASRHQQVLFFTCHSHMKKHFSEHEILTLQVKSAASLTIRS